MLECLKSMIKQSFSVTAYPTEDSAHTEGLGIVHRILNCGLCKLLLESSLVHHLVKTTQLLLWLAVEAVHNPSHEITQMSTAVL
jgi:hypothetical protein